MVKVGLVMLQGARHAHLNALRSAAEDIGVNLEVGELRTPEDLASFEPDAMVLPGGESTTMRLTGGADGNGLLPAVFDWCRANPDSPTIAICAGVILLADPQDGGEPLIDAIVDRNAYGRQIDSFQAAIELSADFDGNFPGIFIRAPRFESIGENIEIVASHQDEVVGIRCGATIALTFHPELSDDNRFHQWLLRACAAEEA